jgi:hypothetical protein
VLVGVFVGVSVGVSVTVGVGVSVGVSVFVGVSVTVAVGVSVGVGVVVSVLVGVLVGVSVGVSVTVGVGVSVFVGVLVGVSDLCQSPVNLSATNITTSSADLLWTVGGVENSWDLIFGEAGFDLLTSGTIIQGVNQPAYILSGLASGTAYDFYVRSDCGANGLSEWAGPAAFTTLAFGIVWTSCVTLISVRCGFLSCRFKSRNCVF